ncbi:hypothetical protein [Caulobacter endophyticus]|uniref:hypothetical protein n=1 Tax=Caulobacter endophyticus TaxID=2172652 RepID=UPI003D66BA5C
MRAFPQFPSRQHKARHPGRSGAESRDPGAAASYRPPPMGASLDAEPSPLGPG